MVLTNIDNIYLIGDTHFGVKNNSIEWSQIQKDFFLKFFFEKIEPFFNPDKDIIIFEGDIFHYREAVNVRVQNEVFDIFTFLAKKFKRGVFAITGNHDTYYKDNNTIHSLRALSNLADNIHIFESPEILSINGMHDFLMVPWIEEPKKLKSILADHLSFCQYVICHTDMIGFKFNKWVTVEKGLDPKTLEEYKRVYSGHIHIRQQKGNILYTGSPYQMDRGDSDNVKGFYVLGVNTQTLEETFITNTYSPIFVKYKINDILEMSIHEILKAFNNNFVDILIDISFANKFNITRFLEEISQSKHRKLEFFTYSTQESKTIDISEDFDPDDNFNLVDIFKSYVKTKDYSRDFKKQVAIKFIDLHNRVKEEKDYA